MRVRRRVAIAACAVAGLLGVGCRPCGSGPESVHLRTVQLVDGAARTALGEAGLDPSSVEAAVRSALSSAGFQLGDGRCAYAAGVEVSALRIGPGAGAGPSAELALEVVLRPFAEGPAPRSELGEASVPLGLAGPRDAWRRALAAAAERAASGLAVGLRADGKTVDGLVADLSAKDPRFRQAAARVLGERRAREAVPALVARLGHEDPRLTRHVVAALAQIGDERAVPALIDLSGSGDPGVTARLVPFIGDLGGAEAEAYLLTLASGHPDPRVRAAAGAALDALARRGKDAPVAHRSAKMPAP